MKPILISLNEYGALNYFLPVLLKLLEHNYKISLITDLRLKKDVYVKIKNNIETQKLVIYNSNNFRFETIKNYKCIICSATAKKVEHDLITQSLTLKIPSIQFVDNIYGWKKRLTFNGNLVLPDYLCCISEKCFKFAVKEGIPKNIMVAIGHPVWESIEKFKIRKNRNTLFIGQPIFEIYKNRLGYSEKNIWNMCIRAKKEYPIFIKSLKYLLHPSQNKPPYVKNNFIIKNINKYYNFGQIIGIFSAYLTESWLMNKKVISIQPNSYKEDKWIASKYYKEKSVKNYKEFINILKKNKKNRLPFNKSKSSVNNYLHLIKAL